MSYRYSPHGEMDNTPRSNYGGKKGGGGAYKMDLDVERTTTQIVSNQIKVGFQ